MRSPSGPRDLFRSPASVEARRGAAGQKFSSSWRRDTPTIGKIDEVQEEGPICATRNSMGGVL